MPAPRLEHVNISVRDPHATAAMLDRVFGWKIRWEGDALAGGYTVHVGSETDYVAIYAPKQSADRKAISKSRIGNLNHVGVVVEDLDATEKRVVAEGFMPVNHADYEPGKRFYFDDADEIEWEVVSYS